jgi:hypothetical protein
VPDLSRLRHFLPALAVAALLAGTAGAATSPQAVKTTKKNEVGPAQAGEWLAWSASRQRDVSPFDLYARQGGGHAFKVNPYGTQAYAGGISGTKLLYQLIRGPFALRSDLRIYDLEKRSHGRLPQGVNTDRWECCGTIWDDWILFSRGRAFTGSTQLVILRNLVTGEQRVLDALRNKKGLLSAGQIHGDSAVWTKCDPYPQCQIIRYEVTTATATSLQIAPGKVAYAPSVGIDGTVYYVRSNRGCGKHVELVKNTISGSTEILYSFPAGQDVDVTYAGDRGDVDTPPILTRVYFDRELCRSQKWDILRVNDIEPSG